VFGGGEGEAGCFGIGMYALVVVFLGLGGEGFDELVFGAVGGVFLLEEGL
jgi:hypothetical protein